MRSTLFLMIFALFLTGFATPAGLRLCKAIHPPEVTEEIIEGHFNDEVFIDLDLVLIVQAAPRRDLSAASLQVERDTDVKDNHLFKLQNRFTHLPPPAHS